MIYLLTCIFCKKQYLGQTVDEFSFRWNNSKSNCRKHQRGETCMQQHLCEHHCSSNYYCFISDVSVTFIDETDHLTLVKKRLLEKYPENYGSLCEEVWRSLSLAVLHLERQCSAMRSFCWPLSECEHMYVLGLWLSLVFISFSLALILFSFQ